MGNDDTSLAGLVASTQRAKANCWEVMQCGREPGGARAADLGVCAAAEETRLHGVLGGINGGRCCWVVAGTFCESAPSGTFAQRLASCRECPFFRQVQREEFPFVWHAATLLLYLSEAEAKEWSRGATLLRTLMEPAVIAEAMDHPHALRAASERHVTALFADLTGFSAVSAALDSEGVAAFLHEYLSAMTEILHGEQGTLDKYVGDGIVAIFGAPVALENDARAAARAALRMQQRFEAMRADWERRGAWGPAAWRLRLRIGLGTGLAKVGFMGTAALSSYTMTGSTVNLASWLERSCKGYGTAILVSETTHDLIADEMVLRRVGTVRPKGQASMESIYDLLGARDDVPVCTMHAAQAFEAGLDLFERGELEQAGERFRESARCRDDEDPPTSRLLRKCERRLRGSLDGRRAGRGRRQRGRWTVFRRLAARLRSRARALAIGTRRNRPSRARLARTG